MFLHLDSNTFYASCERVFQPALSGRPVVVLSNNDGCIVTLTKEAKALGLKRGFADVSGMHDLTALGREIRVGVLPWVDSRHCADEDARQTLR